MQPRRSRAEASPVQVQPKMCGVEVYELGELYWRSQEQFEIRTHKRRIDSYAE